MASNEILSQTLSAITAIKLDQLEKQKNAYESKKHSLLEDSAIETDTRKRAKFLVDGTSKLHSIFKNPLISTYNIMRFLEQAQYDPSVSEPLLQDYEDSLRNQLQVQSNKYEFASLYGKLVNEWIAAGKSNAVDDDTASRSSGSSGGFVQVGREEMHAQRATWEEYVFTAKDTDHDAIQAYLQDVFRNSSKECKLALENLVKNIQQFQMEWDMVPHFEPRVLENCFRGLLRSDVLTNEKRTTLRDFLGNQVVLSEIADVLNMRMAARSSWTWDSPLVVEQRRNLNGRYRFYLDEDLLDTIFIYYIGRRWAVKMKTELVNLVKAEGVWKSDTKPLSKQDARRRRYFLPGSDNHTKTVDQKRQDHFNNVILLDQLPTSMDEVRGNYSEEDFTEPGDTRKTHVDVAQQLLHRIEAEVLLQTRMGKDITVIRSDFKWFGPSIPHSSIFAVLDFFGVDRDWQGFFRRVLEAPMRFKDDLEDAPLRYRKRGTPMCTPLADVFGESLLFCLDFAVNQKADGAKLYRLHDDMWLFGGVETCVKAWQVATEFAAIVGLDFNLEKTGSVQISRRDSKTPGPSASTTAPKSDGLPAGDVKWGFLKLCPSTGRFILNPSAITPHISELRLQLSACRSVLDWVQAWNLYATRFFSRNFGQPANCFSRKHIDDVLATFRDIQQELFPGNSNGGEGVADHLRQKISVATSFPLEKIPPGYLYFPTSLGGLGLQNPFIPLLLVRDLVVEDPDKEIIDKFFEKEEIAYRRAKARFEKLSPTIDTETGKPIINPDSRNRLIGQNGEDFSDLAFEPFMPFEEFTRYRERTSREMLDAYENLMKRPDECDGYIWPSGDVKMTMDSQHDWNHMSGYDRWVIQVYHRDMIQRFGGLEIVDRESLPAGLINMLRQSRFQWQG